MNDPVRLTEPSPATETSGDDGTKPQSTKPQQRNQSGLWTKMSRWMGRSDHNTLRDNFADALLSDAEHSLAFSPEERAMLHNILRLREVRVEDVMVPRADIDAIDQSMTIAELLVLFEESGRSRMPVYCDHLDDPRGMVHIRDLLGYITKQARARRRAPKKPADGSAPAASGTNGNGSARTKSLPVDLGRVNLNKSVLDTGIIRKVLFVPPSMLASDLMERMQATRTQMALIIDEYGGTDGLASLEDIVEMVVGDIEDEHDDEEKMITKASEDVFIIDAKAELEDIAKVIGPDFDVTEQIEDVDTLGGLIFSELGRIPARGELVQALAGFEFHVLDADPRRVKKVRVVRRRHGERRRRPTRADGEEPSGPASADSRPASVMQAADGPAQPSPSDTAAEPSGPQAERVT